MSASPLTAVSNAIIAKVGAAASDSQSAAPRAVTLSLGKSADPLPAGGIFCVECIVIERQPWPYSSWRRHQTPVSLRPRGARSSH